MKQKKGEFKKVRKKAEIELERHRKIIKKNKK